MFCCCLFLFNAIHHELTRHWQKTRHKDKRFNGFEEKYDWHMYDWVDSLVSKMKPWSSHSIINKKFKLRLLRLLFRGFMSNENCCILKIKLSFQMMAKLFNKRQEQTVTETNVFFREGWKENKVCVLTEIRCFNFPFN